MPKVSVIIPFNNVEAYISECLESVKSQTLADIEVILINDASTDKSREIVQKFLDEDNRFKIIDLPEKKGQGYARNRGIEIAIGDYIGFVDSDDFIEKNMFEDLYNYANQSDTDITMCEVSEFDDMNKKYIKSDYYSLSCLSNFEDKVFSAEDTKNEILNINVALWNKIYKREYLLKTGEKFPEGYIYEDLPFFFGTYLPAKRINIVWKVLYNYRVNRRNSTMRQFNNKILDRLPMVSLTYEKLKKVDFLSDMKQKIQAWIINDLFHRYVLLKENYHREFFFLMKKIFQNLEIEDIKAPFWYTVYHFRGYLLVINNTFENFNQKVFNEYLNIHEIEHRLKSKIAHNFELDRRFRLVYEDINKNYKYTEKINNSTKDEVQKELNDIQSKTNVIEENYKKDDEHILKSMNETFSDIYKEISNNSLFTENLKNELNSELITKSQDLYNDIKDLSFLMHDYYIEAGKETETCNQKISNIYPEIDKIKQEYENRFNSLQNEMKTLVDSRFKDCNKLVNNLNTKLLNEIENLKNKIKENNCRNNETVNSLVKELRAVIEVNNLQNEAKLEIFRNEMQEKYSQLKEETKSPLKKFFCK